MFLQHFLRVKVEAVPREKAVANWHLNRIFEEERRCGLKKESWNQVRKPLGDNFAMGTLGRLSSHRRD